MDEVLPRKIMSFMTYLWSTTHQRLANRTLSAQNGACTSQLSPHFSGTFRGMNVLRQCPIIMKTHPWSKGFQINASWLESTHALTHRIRITTGLPLSTTYIRDHRTISRPIRLSSLYYIFNMCEALSDPTDDKKLCCCCSLSMACMVWSGIDIMIDLFFIGIWVWFAFEVKRDAEREAIYQSVSILNIESSWIILL